jgi:hypothetical protein
MSSLRILGLLSFAALALTLTHAEPARALACDGSLVSLSAGTGTFADCAGQTVAYDYTTSGGEGGLGALELSGNGPWANVSPFSDLHITIVAAGGGSMFEQLGSSSFENAAGDFWMESDSSFPSPPAISFVANDASERVFNGDDYSWVARFAFFTGTPSQVDLTIDYTMDVPEPALAVVLLGGLAAVGLAGRRRH